jgi:hypothetical protein
MEGTNIYGNKSSSFSKVNVKDAKNAFFHIKANAFFLVYNHMKSYIKLQIKIFGEL